MSILTKRRSGQKLSANDQTLRLARLFAKPLRLLPAALVAMGFATIAQPAQASPPDGQMEDLQERIVRLCNEAWGNDPTREQQCRTENVQMLDDYIRLINSYSPTSQEYRVLIECSQRWPESITMWKMCANLEMPENPAFKPFDTGPSPVEVLRQYQAARPTPLAQPNPQMVPQGLMNLNNPMIPSGGEGAILAPQQQQPRQAVPSVIQQPSSLTAPQAPSNLAPQGVRPPANAPSTVYVPGAGIRQ